MKKIILSIFTIVFAMQLYAQRNMNPERIKAQKVSFITERLDLSSKEAQQFWPVYNEFEEVTQNVRQNDLREVREAMRRGNLTDSEAQDLLTKFMAAEEKIHQAKKNLVNNLKNIIPPQKIIALKTAEDAFNRKLLDVLKKRREQMQQKRGN